MFRSVENDTSSSVRSSAKLSVEANGAGACWFFIGAEGTVGCSSLHLRKSGFQNSESREFLAYGLRNLAKLCLKNPKSWALESWIPITIGNQIQVPKHEANEKTSGWNLESTVWNPESRIVLGSLIWGYRVESGAPSVNFLKMSVRKTIWDLEFSEHLL